MAKETVKFHFKTLEVPPPFAHEFNLQIDMGESLDVQYNLHYTERDEISPEEIESEGFSENDDFEWSGSLNSVWKDALMSYLNNIDWQEDQEPDEHTQTAVHVEFEEKETEIYDDDKLEYFLQEITQAIYETASLEEPLKISFIRNIGSNPSEKLDLTVSFSSRSIQVSSSNKSADMAWKKGNALLKHLYMGDYQTKPHKTKDEGIFVSFEPNQWFDLKKIEAEEGISGLYDAVESGLESIKF